MIESCLSLLFRREISNNSYYKFKSGCASVLLFDLLETSMEDGGNEVIRYFSTVPLLTKVDVDEEF